MADRYRVTLGDFLGATTRSSQASATSKHGVPINRMASLADTLKMLDVLDRRRREAESRSVIPLPGSAGAQ